MEHAKLSEPTAYVGYLDKEMTIMGVLSGFSVSGAAAVLWKVTGAKDKEILFRMAAEAPLFTFGGTALVLVAALFFYRQRSLLAFYYGQIVLAASYPKIASVPIHDLLVEADCWATWLFYRWAFVLLALGFVGWAGGLGLVLVLHECHPREWGWPIAMFGGAMSIGIGAMTRVHHVLSARRHEEKPLTLRKFFQCRTKSRE